MSEWKEYKLGTVPSTGSEETVPSTGSEETVPSTSSGTVGAVVELVETTTDGTNKFLGK